MKNKNSIILGIIFLQCLGVIGFIIFRYITQPSTSTTLPKVLISQIVEHPALQETVRGIIDTLQDNGYQQDKTIDIRVESAQGNPTLAQQIASKFVHQNPAVVVGVGTVAAQSFAPYAARGRVKLVFSSITDPLDAQLVQTLQKPGNNTSGVSNFIDLKPQLELFKKLQPSLQRLGFLYNAGEMNSISIIKKLERLCPSFNITLVTQTVTTTNDVMQRAVNLAQQVDAIFISNDRTALSSLQSIIKAAQDTQIPVYVSDTDAVKLGAVAALGPNQYEIGQQTGRLIIRILKGENIAQLPVEFPTTVNLIINRDAARKAGITIPTDLPKDTIIIDQEKGQP